jgi:hypothetical protein
LLLKSGAKAFRIEYTRINTQERVLLFFRSKKTETEIAFYQHDFSEMHIVFAPPEADFCFATVRKSNAAFPSINT